MVNFTYKHYDWLQWRIYKDGDFYIEVTNSKEDAKKLCDLLNSLYEENHQLKWILQNYNPEDLDVPFDDQELQEFIKLLYAEKEYINPRNVSTNSGNDEDKSCEYCKHFQLDGMFGIWCDKDHNWTEVENGECGDWER